MESFNDISFVKISTSLHKIVLCVLQRRWDISQFSILLIYSCYSPTVKVLYFLFLRVFLLVREENVHKDFKSSTFNLSHLELGKFKCQYFHCKLAAKSACFSVVISRALAEYSSIGFAFRMGILDTF